MKVNGAKVTEYIYMNTKSPKVTGKRPEVNEN